MNKFFNTFTGGLLCASAYILPSHGMDSPPDDILETQKGIQGNYIFNPDYIFEEQKGGKVTLSHCTTRADVLHLAGIKGQCKNGKRLIAAIIDHAFYPDFTALLDQKGLIYPAAFSEHFILNPAENLNHVNVKELEKELKIEQQIKRKSTGVIENNEKKIKDLLDRIYKKDLYDVWLTRPKTHGSGVMEAIHLIAPQGQFLPFDIDLENIRLRGSANPNRNIIYGIRKAIQYGADVINISRGLDTITNELVEACQEATRQGIPILIASGNDSTKSFAFPLDKKWSSEEKTIVNNPLQDLFEQLGGKGIRFVGALKYGKNGEEKVTHYTQLPSHNTGKYFLFAAGNHLPIHGYTDPEKLCTGTSFSAPTVAGGYLLLKQYALDKGYPIFSEDLLDIMYESGRDVHFCPSVNCFTNHPPQNVVYKSMDLVSAQRKLDEKFNSIPKSVVSPVTKTEMSSLGLKTESTATNGRRRPLKRTTGTIFSYRPGIGYF